MLEGVVRPLTRFAPIPMMTTGAFYRGILFLSGALVCTLLLAISLRDYLPVSTAPDPGLTNSAAGAASPATTEYTESPARGSTGLLRVATEQSSSSASPEARGQPVPDPSALAHSERVKPSAAGRDHPRGGGRVSALPSATQVATAGSPRSHARTADNPLQPLQRDSYASPSADRMQSAPVASKAKPYPKVPEVGGPATASDNGGTFGPDEEPDARPEYEWPNPNCPRELPQGSTREDANAIERAHGCRYLHYCQAKGDGTGEVRCWWGAWQIPPSD
jgi:hypothetical protein